MLTLLDYNDIFLLLPKKIYANPLMDNFTSMLNALFTRLSKTLPTPISFSFGYDWAGMG